MRGHHSLEPGEIVDFEWKVAEQDGCAYRAVEVRPRRPRTGAKATKTDTVTNAYLSRITITPDEGP
jgi:hypothetical protein